MLRTLALLCKIVSERRDQAMKTIVSELVKVVPPTFMALTQISFKLPDETKDLVGDLGGLRRVLDENSDMFAVATIGKVLVARRKVCVSENQPSHFHSSMKISQRKEAILPVASIPMRSCLPPEVQRICPTFVVPMSAAVEAGLISEREVSKFVAEHESFLDLVDLREAAGLTEDSAPTPLSSSSSSSGCRLNKLFFRLHIRHHGDPCAGTSDVALRRYQVEEHDAYRLARLLPVKDTIVIDSAFCARAKEVVPAKEVCHVLASNPNLFFVQLCGNEAQPVGASSGAGTTPKTVLHAKFLLDPKYVSHASHSAEEVMRKISEWKESRRVVIANREEKRTLQRALQYLTHPLPHLDHLVFAYFLFDSLGDAPVEVSDLIAGLPEYAKNCTPVRLEKFFKAFPHLLHAFKMDTSFLVQRADIPRPEMRDPLSLTAEEVVLSVASKLSPQLSPDAAIAFNRIVNLPHEVRRNIRLRGLERIFAECPLLVQVTHKDPVTDSIMFNLVGKLRETQAQRHAAWLASPAGVAATQRRLLRQSSETSPQSGGIEAKS
jgi:hypothetical protein